MIVVLLKKYQKYINFEFTLDEFWTTRQRRVLLLFRAVQPSLYVYIYIYIVMTGILNRRRERKGERWAPFRYLSKHKLFSRLAANARPTTPPLSRLSFARAGGRERTGRARPSKVLICR